MIVLSDEDGRKAEEIPNIENILYVMEWIPVSEGLPDDLAEVNVTWVNHNPEPYYAHVKDVPYTGFAVYYNGNWYWWTSVSKDLIEEYGDRLDLLDKVDDAIEITAWMPMPKPYERKDHE